MVEPQFNINSPTLWADDIASSVLQSSFEDLRDVRVSQRILLTEWTGFG